MLPSPLFQELAGEARAYPFIYPPIWAAATASLQEVTDFAGFQSAMHVLNALLIPATVLMAWHAVGRPRSPELFASLALLILSLSFVGLLALAEDQPQIIVSFLIVAAVARDRDGAQTQAGMLLALAAALKVYPALFALLWIASKRYRAVAAFAVFGALLGATSVAVAGWPAHALYLAHLSEISQSALLTPVTYNLAPQVLQIFTPEVFVVISPDWLQPGESGWRVAALTPWAALVSKLALACMLLGLVYAMSYASTETRYLALWPFAITVVSLLSPLAWSYHFIPAVAFAPVLLTQYGLRRGILLLAVTLGPLLIPIMSLIVPQSLVILPRALLGTIAMLTLAALFIAPARARHRSPTTAPQPAA